MNFPSSALLSNRDHSPSLLIHPISGVSPPMAGNHLLTAELTSSGRPVLLPNEIECFVLSNVELESDDSNFSLCLKSGLLILTTHRLIWIPDPYPAGSTSYSIPLPAVSHIYSLTRKSIKSMFASPRLSFQLSVGPDGCVDGMGTVSRSVVVTAVMRGKGDVDAFVGKFWEQWRARAWEKDSVNAATSGSVGSNLVASSSGGFDSSGMRVVGVAGILRREQETWESTDKTLHDAFQDLNALMNKAKEMVMLAERMRLRLLSGSSQAGTPPDEEVGSKEEIQDLLLSVGIVSPVTRESAGALYHQQLSRQLADFVRSPLERSGGVISLVDIYCLFNRARGTELISPDDLLQACSLWDKFDVPVMLRKFDSGVMVIQNKSHRDEEVFSRIRSLVTKPDALRVGVSTSDAALTLGIAPAMAKEHLLNAEIRGLLCRDVSPDGFRFYINLFPDMKADDTYISKSTTEEGIYGRWIEAVTTC